MPQKGKVRAEEKVETVRMYESGEVSLHQAAKHADVGETSIRRWIARYKAEGAAGFLPYAVHLLLLPFFETASFDRLGALLQAMLNNIKAEIYINFLPSVAGGFVCLVDNDLFL